MRYRTKIAISLVCAVFTLETLYILLHFMQVVA